MPFLSGVVCNREVGSKMRCRWVDHTFVQAATYSSKPAPARARIRFAVLGTMTLIPVVSTGKRLCWPCRWQPTAARVAPALLPSQAARALQGVAYHHLTKQIDLPLRRSRPPANFPGP